MEATTNYIPELVTAPTFSALTLEEAKKQVEVSLTDSTHDEHLLELILSAAEQVESDTGLYLCRRTLKVNCANAFDGMQLQGSPIASVSSIKYYDTSNVQQTLSATIYNFDAAHRKIHLKYLQVLPTYVDRWDAWEITYLAGYADQYSVPALAKKACLLNVAGDFYDRGDLIKESEQRKYERTVSKLRRATYP